MTVIDTALLLAVLAEGPQAARETPMPDTIAVTGLGTTTLTPDRVTFTVGVETMAPSVRAAVEENNARTAAVLAALKKEGATDKEIRTAAISIAPQMDYQQGRAPRVAGYQVSNRVTVTRSDLANVGRFLQAAIDAGANQVMGVSFVVADPWRGREQGLQAAFADARAKADVLARAAGRTVGRAISIGESGAAMPPPRPMAMMRAGVAGGALAQEVPVEPGTEEIRFNLSVVFELK
jgi:uncharacterized protein YggE